MELDFSDFEILILPDEEFDSAVSCQLSHACRQAGAFSKDYVAKSIKVIPTGKVSPAEKRDIALKYAKGEILAFIDDDAYPRKDWLKNAMKNFSDLQVAAVGGPAITAKEDNLRQRASGLVYASALTSGAYNYRYIPKPKREVDDYPTCNLLVRKSLMQELGGFDTKLWPGEDTKLCRDITKKLHKKIIYDPEVLVWHHRRQLFLPHLKQVARFALHRGYFTKRFSETSLRLSYFIPSLFLFALITGGIFSLVFRPLRPIYSSGLFLYFIIILISSISKELQVLFFVTIGKILTHITYGFYFLKGLLSSKLREER